MFSVIDRNTPFGTSLSPELYPEGYVIVLDSRMAGRPPML